MQVMIFGDAAKLAERFGQCQDVEEVWQAALEVFSVFGKCWISYGVSDYHQSKLYAYRNSGDTAFAEYYVKNNLRDIDCLFHHIRSSRETLCVSIGDIEDVDRFSNMRKKMDPHLALFGVSAIIYQPFREGELYAGFGAWFFSDENRKLFLSEEGIRSFRTTATMFRAHYDFAADPKSIPEYIDRHRIGVLSPRERESLRWLSEGHQTDRIAHEMGISMPGVKKHFASARKKLGARTREQALALAIRYGQI